jgi:hypothetical protein
MAFSMLTRASVATCQIAADKSILKDKRHSKMIPRQEIPTYKRKNMELDK